MAVALLGFGLLVIMHEFGHLIAAKRGGIRVNEFWVGMGPKLLSRQIGETEYSLCLLPLGGACVMEGENGDEDPKPGSFMLASRPRRFLVLIAGVTMNLLAGFAILLCLSFGQEQWIAPRIDSFYEGFQHEGADGLMTGDRILSIDGYTVLLGADVSQGLARGSADGVFDITVRRNGEIVALDSLAMSPDFDLGDGRIGYGLNLTVEPLGLGSRVYLAAATAVSDVRLVWNSLSDLVTGRVGVDMLSGPVGVTSVLADTAASSLPAYWNLVAFISINLAVMNLLPIPGLDGGRILLLAVETIRRKPLDPRFENYINAAGMVLLLALMVYITGNDFFRLLS
ncbi:MAG: site-2 protease family protein, partial [Butyricicoccus sp.]|nr:site-2 protease family protein [Butyricicoccus sp.]